MSSDKKQIYIVDDDESICRALKYLVASFGFEVRTFLSAEDFFSAVPNEAPGCLIMDIHLPGLNGWDAQQRLMKKGSNRPIVFITADQTAGFKERALKGGAVGFFQKPINNQEFVHTIYQASSN